jgi:hypothetical protein
MNRAARVDPADMDRVDPADMNRAARVDPADMDRVDPADMGLAARVGPVDLNRVDPVARVDLDRVDPVARVDLTGLVLPVAHHRRRTCSGGSTTAVARNSAVLEMHRTASVHPTTVRLRRRRSVGSAGTTGLLPGILRRTGMDRRLPEVGTVRRLPEVGTRRGTALAAT